MGAGMLSLPIAIHLCGSVVAGVLCLFVFAVTSDYSLVMMVRAKHMLTPANSLEEIGKMTYGRPGSVVVKVRERGWERGEGQGSETKHDNNRPIEDG